MTKKHLLVEGWRGVNHSIALVNQHQLLELVRRPSVRLSHRDRPFAIASWNRQANASGFTPEDMARIDAIPAPGNERPTWCSACRLPLRRCARTACGS